MTTLPGVATTDMAGRQRSRVLVHLLVARGVTALFLRRARAAVRRPGMVFSWLLGTSVGVVALWLVLGDYPGVREQRIAWLVPGFMCLLTLASLSAGAARLAADAQAGVLAALIFSPTPPAAYVVSTLAWEAGSACLRACTLLAIGTAFGGDHLRLGPWALAVILPAIAALAVVMAAAGMLLALLVPLESARNTVVLVVSAFGGLASTIYLPADRLPRLLAAVAPWNPISWTCDTIRAVLVAVDGAPDAGPAAMRLGLAAVVLAAGSLVAAGRIERLAAR